MNVGIPKGHLFGLSNEILTLIASNINETCSLLALVKTSTRLRSIAEPFLYRNIFERKIDTEEERNSPADLDDLLQLLKTLLGRPDLAKYIKNYSGQNKLSRGYGHDSADFQLEIFNAVTLEKIYGAVDTHNLDRDAVFHRSPLYGPEAIDLWSSYTAVVLMLAQNIEKLALNSMDMERAEVMYIISMAAKQQKISDNALHTPLPLLSKLKDVTVDWQVLEYGLSISELLKWMDLRSVQNFTFVGAQCTVDGDVEDEDEDEDGQIRVREILAYDFSHVRSIVLDYSAIHPFLLEKVLLKCTGLKQFTYRYRLPHHDFHSFEPPRIWEALKVVKKTLESLTIIDTDMGQGYYGELQGFPIGSFADFPKLKHITMDGSTFYGDLDGPRDFSEGFPTSLEIVEILPPNIERLTLNAPTKKLLRSLSSFGDQLRLFTSLKKINLGWCRRREQDGSSNLTPIYGIKTSQALHFESVCRMAGIEVEIQSLPPL